MESDYDGRFSRQYPLPPLSHQVHERPRSQKANDVSQVLQPAHSYPQVNHLPPLTPGMGTYDRHRGSGIGHQVYPDDRPSSTDPASERLYSKRQSTPQSSLDPGVSRPPSSQQLYRSVGPRPDAEGPEKRDELLQNSSRQDSDALRSWQSPDFAPVDQQQPRSQYIDQYSEHSNQATPSMPHFHVSSQQLAQPQPAPVPAHHYQQAAFPMPSTAMYARVDANTVFPPPAPVTAYPATNGWKKRSNRASQACDQCRTRKSKCNEGEPCSHCSSMGVQCTYKDNGPPMKVTDKSMNAALAEVLEAIKVPFQALQDKVDTLNERLSHLQQLNANATSGCHGHVDNDTFDHDRYCPQTTPSRTSDSMRGRATVTAGRLAARGFDNFDEHTTAAHKLIRFWPGVHALLKEDFPDSAYVHKGEACGFLQLFDSDGLQDNDDSRMDRLSESRSSQGLYHSTTEAAAQSMTMSPNRNHTNSVVSRPDNDALDLRPATVRRLYSNYRHKLYGMHPFVDLSSVQNLIARLPDVDAPRLDDHASSHVPSERPLMAMKKRKRSDASAIPLHLQRHCPYDDAWANQQTLKHAILYLVLALGKVIEEPYPSTNLPDKPAIGAPAELSGRRILANIDVVPGLAYYREACSILGAYGDSNALGCAQARLLAGLYKAQLGRVRESWSWIYDASRICRFHITDLKMNNALTDIHVKVDHSELGRRKNMLLLLSWSCLQLESDILAEFDFPHSGLSFFEADLPYPRLHFDDDEARFADGAAYQKIEHHYLGQLYLRKRLNEMHTTLYGKSLSLQSKDDLAEVLEKAQAAIKSWKDISVKTHVIQPWTDDDPPSSDLLTARLRGKYYGARYIALRPFLDYALHVMEPLKMGQRLEELTRAPCGRQRYSELALFQAMNTMNEAVIKERATRCVQSAINSTVAFDGLRGRLTITNVVGTAHAQFGNMLVLSATFSSPVEWLADLISAAKLRELLTRTIDFLAQLQFASPTARTDLDILRRIEMRLFPDTDGGQVAQPSNPRSVSKGSNDCKDLRKDSKVEYQGTHASVAEQDGLRDSNFDHEMGMEGTVGDHGDGAYTASTQ